MINEIDLENRVDAQLDRSIKRFLHLKVIDEMNQPPGKIIDGKAEDAA